MQTICDYGHDRIQFGYHHARCDRTASEGMKSAVGCRDFAHLAVTLCRCMNIPARYIARGRDAADVAISTQFGNAVLARFDVVTEEVSSEGLSRAA